MRVCVTISGVDYKSSKMRSRIVFSKTEDISDLTRSNYMGQNLFNV